jgi:holo-[acyl-carrier protein] synthase
VILILGIGNDIVDIRRLESILGKYGNRFLSRIYSKKEIQKADIRKNSKKLYISTLAKHFAAKEAAAKALGTGFRKGVCWKDLVVTNLPLGKPIIEINGGAEDQLKFMLPKGFFPKIDLTLSDEYPYAQAFVVISAVSKI